MILMVQTHSQHWIMSQSLPAGPSLVLQSVGLTRERQGGQERAGVKPRVVANNNNNDNSSNKVSRADNYYIIENYFCI